MTGRRVSVVGAGVGGLAAALRLARLGHRVTVFEARSTAGGLAAAVEYDRTAFDAGPYVLLDRPGLEWAFERLGIHLDDAIALSRVEHVYRAAAGDAEPVDFFADRERTAAGLDRRWPGCGRRYRAFVESTLATYERARPLLFTSERRLRTLLRSGAWRSLPFLLRSLRSALGASGLPAEVADAIAIWTHVAGQRTAEAPAAMALVPALIHAHGAWVPSEGLSAVPRCLARRAAAEGVEVRCDTAVRAIRTTDGRVRGTESDTGEFTEADAVVSNAHGVGTYLTLVDAVPDRARAALARLPLQSPGVCAYLRLRTDPRPPYLRFRLPAGGEGCRLLVVPGAAGATGGREGWWPARLIAPLAHAEAERLGASGQREFLHRLLEEPWWREGVAGHEVAGTRVPADWGAQFRLYRDSMNPAMTKRSLLRGRLPHRSPWVRGLYLAGSATDPGQWVSFCAISGILAAERLHRDLA